MTEYREAFAVSAMNAFDAPITSALRVNRRCIDWGARGNKFLGLLPFERSSGALPLPVQCVGQDGVSLGIIWICVDRRLKLDEGLCDLTPLEKRLTRIECKVGTLAADGYAAQVGGLLAFCRCACWIALLDEDCGEADVRAGLIGH